MIGFDDEALAFMLGKMTEDAPETTEQEKKEAEMIFNLALTYDVDYMTKAGIIKDGDYTDEFYDEDDAFDFIVEHIGNAHPEFDGDKLAELMELYYEYHDAYMEEKGLLEWE